jgi:hypothetical protein
LAQLSLRISLTQENFLLLKAHVLPMVRGCIARWVPDGTIEAPEKIIIVIADDKTKIICNTPCLKSAYMAQLRMENGFTYI